MELKITPSGQTIVKPTALGPGANTDTKLLIYGLFQKGRVLAQDGEPRDDPRRSKCLPCVVKNHEDEKRYPGEQDPGNRGCPVSGNTRSSARRNGRDQSVSFARDGLNELRALGIIAQGLSKLPNRIGEDFVGNEGSFPYFLDDRFFFDDLSSVLGEVDQDLHRLGLDFHRVLGVVGADEPVSWHVDPPITDLELIIHALLPDRPSVC